MSGALRRLILVRHGYTDWNRVGRFQGHLDPVLASEGREEARLVAARLAGSAERPARIVTSSLARAVETARIIAAALNVGPESPAVPVVPDPRLMELGQGEWEGHTHAELAETDGERYRSWRAAGGTRPPPGGEPIAAAVMRVKSCLDEAVDARGADAAWPICIVAHGGSLRLAAHVLLDLPIGQAWRLELDNASVSVLDGLSGDWRLVTWNDASHLIGRSRPHANLEESRAPAL